MSPDIKRLVELMIEKDPNLRPTATELLQDPALHSYKQVREIKLHKHFMVITLNLTHCILYYSRKTTQSVTLL